MGVVDQSSFPIVLKRLSGVVVCRPCAEQSRRGDPGQNVPIWRWRGVDVLRVRQKLRVQEEHLEPHRGAPHDQHQCGVHAVRANPEDARKP